MPSHVEDRRMLLDAETRSLAPAYANIVKSLAGRVKFLAEMAVGQSWFDGQPAMPGRNPQGLLGVDFSGPPFGSAWRTPMWWCGGIKEDVDGNWEGQRQVLTVTTTKPLVVNLNFWNRPFAGGERAPHSRCYPIMGGYKATGTNVTWTMGLTYPGDNAPSQEVTGSAASTTETTFSPANAYWNVVSGRNKLMLRLSVDHDMVVTFLGGIQREKRSH